MDIIDIIKNKFRKLNENIRNKRVGICPHGFESLNQDILSMLAEIKISSAYVRNKSGRVHGPSVFVNFDMFLDNIDIYLSWGKDDCYFKALYKKRTQSLKIEVVDILDSKDDNGVIAPLSGKYTYLKLFRLNHDDELLLQNKGYFTKYLNLISKDVYEQEKDYLLKAGFNADVINTQLEFPFFLQSMLYTGYVLSLCPLCGNVCKTNQSFCMFIHAYHQLIFYRFSCCKIFYLIVGDSNQRKIGMYFPEDELMINFVFYNDCPSCEEPYGKEYYEKWVNEFKRHLLFCWDKMDSYISTTSKKHNACLLGFVSNLGHHVADELSAVQKLHNTGDIDKINIFLLGDFDYFKVGDMFPEIQRYPLAKKTSMQIFRIILENNCFAFRLCHKGPIQEKLTERIYMTCKNQLTASFLQKVEESRRLWPLIWITLRSHNRVWLSQKDGLANIINLLYKDFLNLGVIFDGVPAEKQLMQNIQHLMVPGIVTYDALDCKMPETVVWAYAIDLFIAPYGNGTNFTSIANKAGIAHTHSMWMRSEPFCMNRRENCVLTIPVKAMYDSSKDVFTSNYEIDWRDIYDAIVGIIRKLKPRKTNMGA